MAFNTPAYQAYTPNANHGENNWGAGGNTAYEDQAFSKMGASAYGNKGWADADFSQPQGFGGNTPGIKKEQ
jgi:hypothetical protein